MKFHTLKYVKRRKNSKDRRWLWSGLLGGGIVLLVCLFIAIVRPGYRVSTYYINEDPSLLTRMLSTDISTADSITIEAAVQEETKRRKDIIEDLLDQKVIVSSEEFASNLTGYHIQQQTAFPSPHGNKNVSAFHRKPAYDNQTGKNPNSQSKKTVGLPLTICCTYRHRARQTSS